MFGLSAQHIAELRGIFSSVPSVHEAIVYGSRARGDYRKYSDIDITLRGNNITDRDLTRIYFKIDDLLLPYNVDLSVMSQLRNENLINNIKIEGKVLYPE